MQRDRFILNEQLLDLGPQNVITFGCEFETAHFDDALFSIYHIGLPASVARAVRKRRATFFAGRYAVRAALTALTGVPVEVPIAQDGSPAWPDSIIGSITHTDRYALCTVGRRVHIRSLGLDTEYVFDSALARQVGSSILSEREFAYLSTLALDDKTGLTILFSAKESLYKALFPEVRAFFDFFAVELTSLDLNTQTFVFRLRQDLSAGWPRDSLVAGRFFIINGRVVTHVVLSF